MVEERRKDRYPEIHSQYYLHNFLLLCETVEKQYGDLLNPDEREFLHQFRSLDQPAQCLYVRLISRLGPWFRVSKLAYPEIDAIEQAAQALVSAGVVIVAQALSIEQLGSLFTSSSSSMITMVCTILPGS